MRVHRNLKIPKTTAVRDRYDFDVLRHGDAIEVNSINSAREVFRRWRKHTGRRAQLVRSSEKGQEGLLFFIDSDMV